MTAQPITLETALGHQGFTIDVVERAAFDITIPNVGTLHIPAMARSELTWRRTEPATPELGADLYLTQIPIFDDAYKPVILSHILDRYRTRRLGYNTPGQWMLAYRRWMNLNMVIPNGKYRTTAADMPLDDRDETEKIEATSHGLDIGSDFPQSVIGGNTDYATAATDKRTADNATTRKTGRGRSVMELLQLQRAALINVDTEILEGLDSLFLDVYDHGEGMRPDGDYAHPWNGVRPQHWRGW